MARVLLPSALRPYADGAHELLQQINQIVLGFLATTTPREGEAS